MTQFTKHISEKFYNEAVKTAKEVKEYYRNDYLFSSTAMLDFTNKMLDYRAIYMKGIRDVISYNYSTIVDIDMMELSTELDNIISFLANDLYKQLKESK